MLKAPPLNPRTYIYQYYNIDPTEGSYYVQKYLNNYDVIKESHNLCGLNLQSRDLRYSGGLLGFSSELAKMG